MTRLDGIDCSHYQYEHAPIDWPQVRAAGCWWGATKMTQSIHSVDPTGPQSRAGMHAAGFTHIGLYHWLSSTTDPHTQADWFLQHTGRLALGEFAMLDAEEVGITAGMVLTWCERVEASTQRPCAVYTGAYVAGGTIWQSTKVRTSRYGPRPTILAAYTSEANARALPGVKSYPWHAWQFSSNGPVAGVTGRCDMDRVDDRDAFDRAAGVDEPAPPVEVEPPTVPTIPIEEDDDMPKQYVADSASKGSALVTLTADAAGDPHYTMVGFDDPNTAEAYRGALGSKSYSDSAYQDLAAGASH